MSSICLFKTESYKEATFIALLLELMVHSFYPHASEIYDRRQGSEVCLIGITKLESNVCSRVCISSFEERWKYLRTKETTKFLVL